MQLSRAGAFLVFTLIIVWVIARGHDLAPVVVARVVVAAKAIGVTAAGVVFTAHFDPFVECIVSLARGSDNATRHTFQSLSTTFSNSICKIF